MRRTTTAGLPEGVRGGASGEVVRQMVWKSAFRLTRADDLLVLDVNVSGPEPKKVTVPEPGGPAYVFAPAAREIRVQFGPQQIVENAKPELDERKVQLLPLFTRRADLIFLVQVSDGPIPATLEGLLAAIRRLPLKVNGSDPQVAAVPARRRSDLDPHALVAAATPRIGPDRRDEATRARHAAAARARSADDLARRTGPHLAPAHGVPTTSAPSGSAEPAEPASQAGGTEFTGPIDPQPSTSQVPLPRQLAIRPPRGPVRMSHSAVPATRDGRTELWHTRLAVATDDPAGQPVEVSVPVDFDALPGLPQAGPPRDDNTLHHAVVGKDYDDAAAQVAPPYLKDNGEPSPTAAARLDRLWLSALGGWLRLSGRWPAGVKELDLDVAQGRDQRQRKVVAGRLMPFGHKAIITATMTRRFETGGTRVAGLVTRAVLEVVEPLATSDPKGGLQRQWPFASVEILDRGGIVGTEGILAQFQVSTFEVGGLPYRFSCRAVDRSGRPIEFAMPMVFARETVDDATAYAGWVAYTQANQPAPAGPVDPRRTEYFQLGLDGQRLGLTVPPSPANARADESIPDTATTVLARRLDLTVDQFNRPVMRALAARVETLERFAPGTGEVLVEYAQPYLDHLLDGTNAQAQVFLQFAKDSAGTIVQPAVGLAGAATGGLAQLGAPIAGFSRRFGALAGQIPAGPDGVKQVIAGLAKGELDLTFLKSTFGNVASKLLGLVDLSTLIPASPKPKLADVQKISTDVLNGVTRQTMIWRLPLLERTGTPPNVTVKAKRLGFISLEATGQDPQPTDPTLIEPILEIVQQTEADPDQLEMRSTTSCTITGLSLRVYASPVHDGDDNSDNPPIVTIPFKKIGFVTKDGGKPDFDVVLGTIEFGGILRFVRILADLIDSLGLSDPPALEVTGTGVRSSFSFDVPAVAIGMFALQNIAFSTVLDLTFAPSEDQPALLLTVSFASRANPFLLTVSFLGGGGYLEIAAASNGLESIEGSLQFGAALVVSFGFVAKGSIEAMGGVVFRYDRSDHVARLTAFLQIRGEVSVLSLISVSVTLLLELSYDFNSQILSGHAEVVVEVSVWFFSQSVSIPYDWSVKTGNSDPTFAELMAPPGLPGERPWDTYCLAFAG